MIITFVFAAILLSVVMSRRLGVAAYDRQLRLG